MAPNPRSSVSIAEVAAISSHPHARTATGTKATSWRTAARTVSIAGISSLSPAISTPVTDTLAIVRRAERTISRHTARYVFTVRQDFLGQMTYVTPGN